MGCKFFGSSSWSSFDTVDKKEQLPPNPDPSNFNILKEEKFAGESGKITMLMIEYPDCTNYEGKKILLFRDLTLQEILMRNDNRIDPHFSETKGRAHPFARFSPTDEGWKEATIFAEQMVNK